MMINNRKHSNSKLHNWLIYKKGDKYIKKYSKYLFGNLVELGCGEAPYKEYFLQFASSYTGIDWENSLHNTKADIFSDLNNKIDISDNSVDSIISISVLEHLKEPQVMLDESYRILKHSGVLILQVPWQWWVHEAPHDYFRYTPFGLRYMLKKAGYSEISIEPTSGLFTVLIMKFNYFLKRFIRGPLFIRILIYSLVIPFWTIGQLMAPILDKIDTKWEAESQGYFVLAWKQ